VSLYLQYNVDIEFHGHVHAYERKTPIANNAVSTVGVCCSGYVAEPTAMHLLSYVIVLPVQAFKANL